MFRSVNSFEAEDHWLINGGIDTIKSFGVANYKELPASYKSFFENMPIKVEIDNYIFVHAGINNIHFKDPFKQSVALWIRDWYDLLDREWLGDRYIIHGHTACTEDEITKQFELFGTNRYLNIDAGCCYPKSYRRKNNPEVEITLNKLCLVDLTNRKLYFENNCED